jgi:alkanesulfonate monooxygenase SsuD/methylene tetrahydromethanopterin reductase-like flavin-dependent oxidoreductase (luciferase family)
VVPLRQAGREVRVAPGVHVVLAETSDREGYRAGMVEQWLTR